MSGGTLTISANLTLPAEAVTETFAILAKRGAGKTYTAAVLVEELADAGMQFVVRHPRMGEGERRVLLALVDHDDLTHDELCQVTGYSPSASTIGVILSKLRKLGLVEKGARRLAPEFREAITA